MTTHVAIVFPTRNRRQQLERLMDSVEQLRPQPHEVVVADGRSSESTADYLRTFRTFCSCVLTWALQNSSDSILGTPSWSPFSFEAGQAAQGEVLSLLIDTRPMVYPSHEDGSRCGIQQREQPEVPDPKFALVCGHKEFEVAVGIRRRRLQLANYSPRD